MLGADLRLNGERPFALSGSAGLRGAYQRRDYRLETRFSGTLQRLAVNLDASGDTLAGRAMIDATPFDPVPFRQVQIDLAGVDPHAVDPAWPQADLDLLMERIAAMRGPREFFSLGA